METMVVNLILHPILIPQRPGTLSIFKEGVKMAVTINYNTMIKDICSVLLDKIGLGHLTRFSEAFVYCPRTEKFVSSFTFPNQMIRIGSVENTHNQYLTIKIVAKGCTENFSGFDGRNAIYRNLCQFLLKKYPSIQDDAIHPIIRDIIEKINNKSIFSLEHTTLHYINQIIKNELETLYRSDQQISSPVNLSIVGGYNGENSEIMEPIESNRYVKIESDLDKQLVDSVIYPVPILEYRNDSPQFESSVNQTSVNCNVPRSLRNKRTSSNKSSNTRSRIKFKPEIEIPILEEWFKTTKIPKISQLHEFATHLNNVSNRSDETKLTYSNIRNWFNYRRVKERRNITASSKIL